MHTEGMWVYWIQSLGSTGANMDFRRKENRVEVILKETIVLEVKKESIKRGKQND